MAKRNLGRGGGPWYIWALNSTQPPLISICKTKINSMKNMCECKNFKQIIIFSSKHINFDKDWVFQHLRVDDRRDFRRCEALKLFLWNFEWCVLPPYNFFQNQTFDGILFPFSNKSLKNWTYVRQIEGSFEIQIFLPFPCLEWIYGLQFVTCKNKFTWHQLELL